MLDGLRIFFFYSNVKNQVSVHDCYLLANKLKQSLVKHKYVDMFAY
jgi:hypothetical protein